MQYSQFSESLYGKWIDNALNLLAKYQNKRSNMDSKKGEILFWGVN